jgi:3-hydroxyisobutyrate dehydrogenase-like beta-hydroxyacid dehydrogenase
VTLDKESLVWGFDHIAARMEFCAGELDALENRLGSGQLGTVLASVGRQVREELLPVLPDDVGMALLACAQVFAKSTGTRFGGLAAAGLTSAAKATRGHTKIPWEQVPALLEGALQVMMAQGQASLGDKTVLDALDAAAKAARGLRDPGSMLAAVHEAVVDAMDRLRDRPARIFGAHAMGFDDPGMLAFRRMVEALHGPKPETIAANGIAGNGAAGAVVAENIGFIGLGIMGRGMVRNLLRAGHQVTAWNRTPHELPAEMLGGRLTEAASPADVIDGRRRIMISLAGPDAQRELLTGPDGVIARLSPGAILIDTTTTDPRLSLELAAAATDRGGAYLDCPVFGSRAEAWEGRLDFVCGGARTAFDTVRPLLETMAATVHYMGDNGQGTAMKLIGNLLVAAEMTALGEALTLARKAGLDGAAVMEVLDVTDFSSALIRGVGRSTLAGDFTPSFYLRHMLKDARLIEDFACALAVAVPATAAHTQLFQAAVNQGWGDQNASAVHRLLFHLAGIEEE